MSTSRPPRLMIRLFDFLMPFDPFFSHRQDLEELFEERYTGSGPAAAHLWLIGQLLACLPHAARNGMSWLGSMVAHFLRTGIRTWKRNLIPSLVSVGGLAIAGTVAVTMYLFIDLQVNMDSHHEYLNELYVITYETEASETQATWGNPPAPLGPEVAGDFAGVTGFTRLFRVRSHISRAADSFNQSILFVDAGFADLFTVPVLYGRLEGLSEPGTLVLSDAAAIRFFGETDVVGEELQVSFREEPLSPFRVVAVVSSTPVNSSFPWEVLGSTRDIESALGHQPDWSTLTGATVLRIPDRTTAEAVNDGLNRWSGVADANVPKESARNIAGYGLVPLKEVPTLSPALRGSVFNRVQAGSSYVVGFISLLVLLVACFNTINIAIAGAGRRAREIGVRKAVGSYRSHIVMQFLSEQVLLSMVSLLLAILAANFIVIPWVDTITGNAGFGLNFSGNETLWVYLTAVFLITGIGAGLYPAVYMSRFEPTKVLKGVVTGRSKRLAARVFLGVQLVLSFILIACGMVVYRSAVGQRALDWGYEQHHTYLVDSGSPDRLMTLATALEAAPGVKSTAYAARGLDAGGASRTVSIDEHTFDVRLFSGSPGYAETVKLDLAAGSLFPDPDAESSTDLLVNRFLVDLAGFESAADAIGERVRVSDRDYTIRGVVNDFQFQVFVEGMAPAVLMLAPRSEFTSLVLDIVPGQESAVAEQARSIWMDRFSGYPYQGRFQDEMFDTYFRQMEDSAQIFLFVALSAFLIAATGLFGLVLMNTARRTKELSIRRVLGATPFEIHQMAQLETLRVVGFAVIIGAVASWFLARLILAVLMPDGHVVTAAFIVVPVMALTATAVLVTWMGVQSVSGLNPGNVLRTGNE